MFGLFMKISEHSGEQIKEKMIVQGQYQSAEENSWQGEKLKIEQIEAEKDIFGKVTRLLTMLSILLHLQRYLLA